MLEDGVESLYGPWNATLAPESTPSPDTLLSTTPPPAVGVDHSGLRHVSGVFRLSS